MSEQPTRGQPADKVPPGLDPERTAPGRSGESQGRPAKVRSASHEQVIAELRPAKVPVPVLDAAAYDTVHEIEVIALASGGKRLKLNGEEIPLYLPEGYAPSLSDAPAGDFRILSVPFLVDPEATIEHIEALAER